MTAGGESVIMGDMTDLKQNFDAVKFANAANGHCLMNGTLPGGNGMAMPVHGAFQSPYAMTSMGDGSQRFQTLSSSSPMKVSFLPLLCQLSLTLSSPPAVRERAVPAAPPGQ